MQTILKNLPTSQTLEEARAFYAANGYAVVTGLFDAGETAFYREHTMRLRAEGSKPGDYPEVDLTSADPLKRFPRMIHMHRWDEACREWLLDPRLNACLTALLGCEPCAVQTMLYFKPAGARGQALHQDQFYLRAAPGTCMAAWMALDDCDEANGCMQVVPGSHLWQILCPKPADTSVSFTDVTVPVPEGQQARPILMSAGDVLFFNGSLVHGSFPNTTQDRFRRALIGHYITGDAERVGGFYHPILRMDGTPVELGSSPEGGPCGIWTEAGGRSVIEMSGDLAGGVSHE